MPPSDVETVLAFWFPPGAEPQIAAQPTDVRSPEFPQRREWFHKDPSFDAQIRERFGESIAQAVAGGLGGWTAAPRGALARVLLLDQFTRNAYRDTPAAFSGDARARATADEAIARGFDRELTPVERWFLYMPFQHSESLEDQQRSLTLFRALASDTGLASPLEWAERHAEVIRLFGRFPHRNAILGRPSSREELEFLRSPGSRF
jgi:uncharacterized protein (DUF924 family)